MDNIRIAILDSNDNIVAFMDNAAPNALHYHDDELHEYLSGSAYTFEFVCSARHDDSQYLAVGNKLSFIYRDKGYYLNIVQTERDEFEVTVTAYGALLELLNEQVEAYSASSAMSFEEYITAFNFASGIITIGINEVSDKSITNEWTGTATVLSRLYSLATVFSAEIEFVTELAEDYTIKQLTMNVYREHDEDNDIQGMGVDRTNEIVLRYGLDIEGITKKSDITELYTAIRPTGTDGLTITSLDKYEYDDDGAIEYQSPSGNRNIYAVQAMEQFPSNVMEGISDRYICKVWEYDTDNVNTLYGQALAQLKKYCVPQVEYEVNGYFDTGIGDTVRIDDQEFNPALYLTARVTEQIRSFTDPTKNKTTFSNFRELESEIDDSLIEKMNALIEANKTYTCTITTDNGIVFKNNEGTTTLTAIVLDGATNIASDFIIIWYKDGESLATDENESITISATDISGKSVYRFEAIDDEGILRGFYEVTVSNTSDGVGLVDMVAQFGVSDSCETGADEYSDSYIVVDETEYLWVKYAAVLTDGSTINTTAYCLTDGSTRLAVDSISAKVAEIDEAYISYAEIDEAYISYAEIDELVANNATIHDLTADVATIKNAYITTAAVNTLLADYARIDMANVGIETVAALFVDVGLLTDATIVDAKITGTLTGVTIYGDCIVANTVIADALVLQGTDGLYYAINATSDSLTASELTDEKYQQYIDGSVLVAESITASQIAAGTITANEIDVTNLAASKAFLVTLTTQQAFIDAISTNEIVVGAATTAASSLTEWTYIYASSTSYTVAPDDSAGWSEEIPDKEDGMYIWQKIVGTRGNGTTYTSEAACINSADGADGRGISSITEYYARSTSNSTAPASWDTVVPTLTTTYRYLWNYETVAYTDGSTESTAKRVIGVYGNTGATGTNGADGVGIASVVNYYARSTSGTTKPTSWDTTVSTLTTTYKYLWNYEVITYTDGGTDETEPHVVGVYGNTGATGADGADGADGVGIASITEYYAQSTSNSTAPTSWSTAAPTLTTTYKYLWSYEVIAYTDGSTESTTERVIGVYGNTGATGAAGADGQMLYATCSTAAGTQAKVASLTSGSLTLEAGASVAVTFTYANTAASPTLNVGGTGAKVIHVYGSVLSASSGYNWVANSTVQFVYDGTYWVMSENSALYAMAKWCYNNDITYIDGAALYTGTVSADKITTSTLSAICANIGNLTIDGYLTTSASRTSYNQAVAGMTLDANGIGGWGSSSQYWNMTVGGVLTAYGAKIYTGTIGNWTLTTSALYNGCTSSTSTTAGTYIGKTVFRQYSSSTAYVNISSGVLTAKGAQLYGDMYLDGSLYMYFNSTYWGNYASSGYYEVIQMKNASNPLVYFGAIDDESYMYIGSGGFGVCSSGDTIILRSGLASDGPVLNIYDDIYAHHILPIVAGTYSLGSSTFYYNGLFAGFAELYASTPYIDFHNNYSTGDYTHRILASSGSNLIAYPGISSSSDARLKDCIVDLPDEYIALFDSLVLREYRLIKNNGLHVGVIAQEVMNAEADIGITESVIVSGSGGILDNGDIDYYAVDYNAILIMACAKIKQQDERIAALENQLAACA